MKNLKRKLFKVRLMSAVLASIELVNGCSTSYAMMPSNLETLGQEVKSEDGSNDLLREVKDHVSRDEAKITAKSAEKMGEMSPEELLGYLKVGSTLEELKRYCESGELDKSRQDCANFELIVGDSKSKFFNYVKSSILEGNMEDFKKIPVEIRTEFFNSIVRNAGINELEQILINLSGNHYIIEEKNVENFGVMLSDIVDVRSALKIFWKMHTEENDIADAITNDNKDELQRLIAQRLDFKCNDKMFFGCSPIEYAALFGSEKSFKYFIMNGAEITDKVKSLALMGQNLEIIHVINQNEHVFPLDEAAIKCLVCANRDDLCEWLINHFAGMDKIIASVCCEEGNLSILTKIIKCYSDENILEKVFLGRGFFNAASNNNIEMLKFLLEEGVDVNTKELMFGRTALTYAIEARRLEAVKFLIENHANVNDDGNRGKITPLMIAVPVRRKDIDMQIIETLLKNGANINALSRSGEGVLARAVEREDFDLVRFLVDNGANVDAISDEKTPLMLSVEKSNKEIAKFLIEHGADVNICNFYGESALLFAATIGDKEMMQFLIKHGADVNAGNQWRITLLMKLVNRGNDDSCEAIQFLIDNGADANARNVNGMTVMMYAQNNENGEKIVQLLKDNGAE